MSQPQKPTPTPNFDYRSDDPLQGILDGITRFCFWGGITGTVVGLAFLLYTFVTFSGGGGSASVEQAISNVDIFSKILIAGLLGLAVATTLTWWGEETLAVLQLGFAAALYFAPLYIPELFGSVTNEAASAALNAIQSGGQIFGAIAILVLIFDITTRVKARSREGARADLLKYGKGVKEERDIQNVFMGKCWQLPFCRKFVRERCPIFHSRRTCWRERVGCMCEEEVIRGAMENRAIPKDEVMAAKFIPRNTRLTERQKAERCRQCVIYNEHQKHKYRLMLPATMIFFGAFYMLFREPLLASTHSLVMRIDRMMAGATYNTGKTLTLKTAVFEEVLLAAFIIVAFAYAMKVLEFLIFKAKV